MAGLPRLDVAPSRFAPLVTGYAETLPRLARVALTGVPTVPAPMPFEAPPARVAQR